MPTDRSVWDPAPLPRRRPAAEATTPRPAHPNYTGRRRKRPALIPAAAAAASLIAAAVLALATVLQRGPQATPRQASAGVQANRPTGGSVTTVRRSTPHRRATGTHPRRVHVTANTASRGSTGAAEQTAMSQTSPTPSTPQTQPHSSALAAPSATARAAVEFGFER